MGISYFSHRLLKTPWGGGAGGGEVYVCVYNLKVQPAYIKGVRTKLYSLIVIYSIYNFLLNFCNFSTLRISPSVS